jgi:hypothetical protein
MIDAEIRHAILNYTYRKTKCTIETTVKPTSPPVRIARSCKFAFLFSPKPGALTAQT